ncbi:hypothetical protein FGO68_gene745 [Halteria grandinella]|uniref:Uncharacterized protein n=1 Tax=Halteria grandinella TaxID=5974 RepID=A0A8J8T4M6_HALGN|nr:hypothetical protein FGO68_gene745 [Halteria grandinella]
MVNNIPGEVSMEFRFKALINCCQQLIMNTLIYIISISLQKRTSSREFSQVIKILGWPYFHHRLVLNFMLSAIKTIHSKEAHIKLILMLTCQAKNGMVFFMLIMGQIFQLATLTMKPLQFISPTNNPNRRKHPSRLDLLPHQIQSEYNTYMQYQSPYQPSSVSTNKLDSSAKKLDQTDDAIFTFSCKRE